MCDDNVSSKRRGKKDHSTASQQSNRLQVRLDDLKTFGPLTTNQQIFFDAYKQGAYMVGLFGSPGEVIDGKFWQSDRCQDEIRALCSRSTDDSQLSFSAKEMRGILGSAATYKQLFEQLRDKQQPDANADETEFLRTVDRSAKTYAIPTKDSKLITLSLDAIRLYVYRFKSITHMHHSIKFFVTGVGTGLAGYDHKDIAPMFKGCNTNCSFPQEWEQYLKE